jgi:predicted nucleic acid-binding Zn ribbon protein
MNQFKWKCPLCETINSDVACKKCTHVPEYYLPLDNLHLKAEKLKAIPGEPFYQEADWECPICGTTNPAGQKKCQTCEKNKVKKRPRVRSGVIIPVALVSFFIILVVVVGKLVLVTRPEVLSGDWQTMFSVPTVAPIVIPTSSPIVVEVSRVYPNPPEEGCALWSQVTAVDEGKTICVYGLVVDTYVGAPEQFYVRFSKERDDFRMVMMNVEEPPELIGECVYQTGQVKVYQSLPYISFSGEILRCQK